MYAINMIHVHDQYPWTKRRLVDRLSSINFSFHSLDLEHECVLISHSLQHNGLLIAENWSYAWYLSRLRGALGTNHNYQADLARALPTESMDSESQVLKRCDKTRLCAGQLLWKTGLYRLSLITAWSQFK